MKLVYLFLGGGLKESSVQHKINCQITELNANGIETSGWFFSTGVAEATRLNEFVEIHPLKPYIRENKYFKNFHETEYYVEQIHEYLRNNNQQFDFIFLRHGSSGPAMVNLIREFGQRIFLYIPSNSIAENFREKQYAGKVGPLSFIIRWIEYYWCFYRHEKRFWVKYLNRLKAIVVFTPEFGNILQRISNKPVKIIYNRDGADCANVKLRNPLFADGKIKLLFLKGSSMNQPWAGIDRLIESIESTGRGRFLLYITGKVFQEEKYNKPFIKLTGMLGRNELDALVDEMDLGVSNLANYMINFNETTNLKSREYYAMGLPFIQGNTMPDVDLYEEKKYYKRVSNDATKINMDEVYDFALTLRNDKEHPLRMRKFAQEKLDWKITVAELAESFRNAAMN